MTKKEVKVGINGPQKIKAEIELLGISEHEISVLSKINYPLFSFKYLEEVSYSEKDVNGKFFQELISRLKRYSALGWEEMNKSARHGYGWEKIGQQQMKHKLPSIVTPEVDLIVLRSSGDNKALVGFREWKIFHVVFIEAKHNDIYKHS